MYADNLNLKCGMGRSDFAFFLPLLLDLVDLYKKGNEMSEVVATSFGMVCAYRLFWWAIVNSQGTTISANLDWTVNHLRLQDLVRGNKGENGGHVFFCC